MSLIENVKGGIRGIAKIPTKSTFLQDGKLTPDEFVEAGNRLKFKCPSWQWAPGDPKKALSYLPPDKQFLSIKHIPCRSRASNVTDQKEEALSGESDEWVAAGEKQETKAPAAGATADKGGDDYFDFNEVEPADPSAAQTAADANFRSYDVTITYDLFYNSPRIWLSGFIADGTTPLTREQIFEDMSEDHARKTVTIEPHPHLGTMMMSIHPCKHASLMKTMVDRMKDSGKTLGVEQYFFTFLKFISSIVPTLEIENTVEVE
ncbi:MAG: putative autophagy protein 3 [Streblomastix strix]|uniref:Putative autophagy protein 3 n=1 Tax=Streblomastix strix TaxID=222440 RepID=A0A5J4UY34_9EUKA|nr:MAG: putative autophagy protein 3 [Streblomastix strix]